MVEVKFYDTVNDELLKFAVIISQSNGKWVFCAFCTLWRSQMRFRAVALRSITAARF